MRKVATAVCAGAFLLVGCDDGDADKPSLSEWAAEACSLGEDVAPPVEAGTEAVEPDELKARVAQDYRRSAERLETFADDFEDLGDPPIDSGEGFTAELTASSLELAHRFREAADRIDAIVATDMETVADQITKALPADVMGVPLVENHPEVWEMLADEQPGCALIGPSE